MDYFSIQTVTTNDIAEQEKKMATKLYYIAENVSSILGQLSGNSALKSDLRSELNSVGESISAQQGNMARLSAALYEATMEYEAVEKEVCQCAISAPFILEQLLGVSESVTNIRTAKMSFGGGSGAFGGGGGGSRTGELKEENKEPEIWNTINKYIGKCGYFGSLASFAGNLIGKQIDKKDEVFNEESWREDSIDALKGGFSIMKTLSKWQNSNIELDKLAKYAPNWAKEEKLAQLVGLNCKMGGKASTAGTWGKRFVENVNKSDGIFDDFTKGGSKSFFAWAGVVVDGAINAYENYQECEDGKISKERAAFETITETAVDFAVDFTVGTAVTAALAATPIGAPVLLVGACTIGVKSLLDWGTEKLLDKNLTEAVSDFYVDLAEGTMKTAVQTGKVIGEFIGETGKAVGEAVSKGTQKVVSGIGNAITDGWNSLKTGISSVGQGFKTLFT